MKRQPNSTPSARWEEAWSTARRIRFSGGSYADECACRRTDVRLALCLLEAREWGTTTRHDLAFLNAKLSEEKYEREFLRRVRQS